MPPSWMSSSPPTWSMPGGWVRAPGPAAGAARRGSRGSPDKTPRRSGSAWDHGYQVSERGRIPTDVVTAYQAAHSEAR